MSLAHAKRPWCSLVGLTGAPAGTTIAYMNQFDQLLASPPLTSWVLITAVAWIRAGVAGLFAGKGLWFHPINYMNRVDRSEPGKSLNERRFRQRTLEVLIALALGWLPGLLVQRLFGSVDPRLILTVLAGSVAAAVIYVFRAMRRFDREGRERYLQRAIAEESARGDSAF
jgi:hypothetical protein